MATLASSPPSSPAWPKRRPRAWALRCERYCCVLATYFPLGFVYSLTTWAVYVGASIGLGSSGRRGLIGIPSTIVGVALYCFLNACYTVAVFTDPGSPLTRNQRGKGGRNHQYSALPVTELPEYTALTVNSSGGSRYCKKCQCPKPDRTHHCSTCKRCVLKMDHHCPWLATCVGLYNYKAFLLFLIYSCFFCWVCFAVSTSWLWHEIFNDARLEDGVLPFNVVLLAILGGIIGLVLSGFTAWHISLAVRGMTTIENLEKTRYVSPLRRTLRNANAAIPGITRPEEGEERSSPAPQPYLPSSHAMPSVPPYDADTSTTHNNLTPAQQALTRSYADLERQRERDRYQDYLDEKDSEKMPRAFDLGWRRNLLHLFGDRPLLWFLPVCTTTGDGWHWEPSKKFLEARERIRQQREQELAGEQQYYQDLYRRNMNNSRAWLGDSAAVAAPPPPPPPPPPPFSSWTPGSNNNNFQDQERPDTGVSMKTLVPRSPRPRPGETIDSEDDLDENNLLLNQDGKGTEEPMSGRLKGRGEESDEWRHWD